jgi:hypothetical protein
MMKTTFTTESEQYIINADSVSDSDSESNISQQITSKSIRCIYN